MPREPANVDLVDDRLLDGDVRVAIVLPVEVALVGDATRRPAHVRDLARAEVAVGVVGLRVLVAKCVAGQPIKVPRDRRRVRVEQRLVDVEPLARPGRIVRSIGAQVIEGPVGQPLDEDVPGVARAVGLGVEGDDLRGVAVGDVVEEEELDPRRPRGVDREVDPVGLDRGAERFGLAGEDVLDRRHRARSGGSARSCRWCLFSFGGRPDRR